MDYAKVAEHITAWLAGRCREAGTEGFVTGVSGGIDSAVCSALAARTGLPVLCATLHIHQPASHSDRAGVHLEWLKSRYDNVECLDCDLTGAFDSLRNSLPRMTGNDDLQMMTEANTRSRLRMTALYYFSGSLCRLVVGTGNKIEDFGIGFFTKYGDGGVDISPIGDLTKTEVYGLAGWLGIDCCIMDAPPSDGLFGDCRSDEEQIGASYPELEWAMEQAEQGKTADDFEGREKEVIGIYIRRHKANMHKMTPIPVCAIPEEYK